MKKQFIIWIVLVLTIVFLSQIRLDQNPTVENFTKEKESVIAMDSLNVRYQKVGKGPALLLIHGTASSLDTWDGWTNKLKKHFTVYRMDLPGFGFTGPNFLGDYSLNMYSDFLDRFMAKFKIKRAHIVGNSLGGQIAWDFSRRFPYKVNKLVLISPAGLPSGYPTPAAIGMGQNWLTSGLMKIMTPLAIFKKSILEVYGDSSLVTNKILRHYYELTLAPGNRQAFVDRVQNLEAPNPAFIKAVKAPTLVMWGKKDRWLHPNNAKKFCKLISNCRVVSLANEGHIPMEESPDKSLKPALKFLRL